MGEVVFKFRLNPIVGVPSHIADHKHDFSFIIAELLAVPIEVQGRLDDKVVVFLSIPSEVFRWGDPNLRGWLGVGHGYVCWHVFIVVELYPLLFGLIACPA